MKNLIIYYSRRGENYVAGKLQILEKGNAQLLADYIREAAGADVFEIVPVRSYSADYMTCTEEAKEELNQKARPALKEYLQDISGYQNIFIVGPCWWGTYPMPMFTQLEKLDFSGKKVFPVMTHEGSGLAGSAQALKKYCEGAVVGNGLAIHGADAPDSRSAVENWAKTNLKQA